MLSPEQKKLRKQEQNDRWKLANWERSLFLVARNNARRMGREFSISQGDIIIPKSCPYLGVELTRELRRENRRYNPSLDRIDSSRGYTKDNIQIISIKANSMKSDFTAEQLLVLAHNIIKMHKGI